MSQMKLVIQSLNPFEKICPWALMIAVNVSVAICQLPICQFCSLGKTSIIVQYSTDVKFLKIASYKPG